MLTPTYNPPPLSIILESTPPGTCATAKCDPGACMPRQCEEHLNNKIKEEYTQMTIDEIINGKVQNIYELTFAQTISVSI